MRQGRTEEVFLFLFNMSESEMLNNDANEEFAAGPGQAFMHYTLMEELAEKLKMLNYEKEFVKDLKQKSISRYYFAVPTNPGEQFYLFAALSAWLVRKCGKQFEQPQEYDDPNSTISTILDYVREFGVTVDFAPNRLKQGCGEHVVFVLSCLVNQALKVKNVKWNRAEPKEEPEEAAKEVDDEAELVLEKVEEEMAAEVTDEEDDGEIVLNLDDLRNVQMHRSLLQQQRPEQVLQSTVRSEEWQIELERVLPQLRVTVQADARDWRTHLEQMHKYRGNMEENLNSTKTHLEKLEKDIVGALDKIDSRERHINAQLEALLAEYRQRQGELSKVSDQYKSVSSGISERSKILTRLTDELENVKKEMEERSSSMTDGSPLINVKRAVTKIKAEMKDMDVRLGVLDCEILQARLRRNALHHFDINSPMGYM